MNRVKTVSLHCRMFFCVIAVFLWTGKVLALNATDTIHAASFSGQSGVTTEACSEGGQDVTSIQNGSYIYFDSVSFGSSGIQCFEARIASYAAYAFPGGGFIEVHLDSLGGTLIGTCETRPGTGGWQSWHSRTCRVSAVSGTHNLYLKLTGAAGSNLFSLEWIKFHGTQTYTKAGWRLSTSSQQGKWNGSIALSSATTGVTPNITIYKDSLLQRVEGFGGAFNDIGAYDIAQLTPSGRATVMKELFDPNVGCKFDEGRVPIGISDFSITNGNAMNYSLDELPSGVTTDYAMQYFTIAHDTAYNIPYVKAARRANPNLCVYGSVWTPPTWMKSNKSWQGPATLAQDSTTLTAYSLYMRKFVQGWEAAGIPVYVVFPQNEPAWNVSGQPACGWSGAQLRDYTKNYLAPGFIKGGCNTEVWMGDFCCSSYSSDLEPCLDDTLDRKLIRGCAPHRNTAGEMAQAMNTANALNLHWHSNQDEGMCWSGDNSWADAESTMSYLLQYYAIGQCNIYNAWNMILDSNWNSGFISRAQNSLITVNVSPKTVHYNYEFFTMKHFSYYVAVGANVVMTQSTYSTSTRTVQACGFKNPDGTIIVEVQNYQSSTVTPVIKIDSFYFSPTLPAQSHNTFILGYMQDTSNWVPGSNPVAVLPEAALQRGVLQVFRTLTVYDIRGRLIKRIDNPLKTQGLVWDRTDAGGRKVPPGLYIIMGRTGKDSFVQKIMCQ